MIDNLMLYTGSASRGFLWLEEVIRSMSTGAIWAMGILFLAVVGGASVSGRWWPSLALRISRYRNFDFEWIGKPQAGGIFLTVLYFFLFPLWSIFASDPDAWWLFLLFGWGMVFVIIFYAATLAHATQQRYPGRDKDNSRRF